MTSAVLLAAGYGRRLAPLTIKCSKPMISVVNRPIAEHIIGRLSDAGIRDIYCNLYYRPADMMDYFGNGRSRGVSITWSIQSELTGPAGALLEFRCALNAQNEFLVLSGDALFDLDLAALVAFHRERRALLTVVVKEVPDPWRYGVCLLDDEGKVKSFVEKPAHLRDCTGLVSCGIYCVSRKILEMIPEGVVYDFGRELIPQLASSGAAVYGFRTGGYWRDIGTLEEYLRANMDSLSGIVDVSIPGQQTAPGLYCEAGVKLGEGFQSCGPIAIGRDVRIGARTQIEGPCVIGPNVTIGTDCCIANSVIAAGTQLSSGMIVLNGILATRSGIDNGLEGPRPIAEK